MSDLGMAYAETGMRALLDEPGVRAPHESRILVVEDDPTYRTLLLLTLKRNGFTNVQTAVDGNDALAQAAAAPPDLVLLDILMPDMDGFTLCRRMRADPRFADIPILVQTVLDNPNDRVRAFRCGATDLVTKPLDTRELIARISIHVERRQLIEGLTGFQSRMKEELRLARQMQHDLLPTEAAIEAIRARYRVDVAGYFEPCSEIGGDLWGIRPIDDSRFGVYVLDFAGHGVASALNTFRIQTMIAELWALAAEPAMLLENLNQRLCETLSIGQFATMFFATLDLGYAAIEFAAAGAPAGVLVGHAEGPPSLLDGTGLPLGLSSAASYPCRHAAMPPGASLFLVSDGLLEARDRDGAMLGAAGLSAVAARSASERNAGAAVAAVVDDFVRRTTGPLADDLTVVCLRR